MNDEFEPGRMDATRAVFTRSCDNVPPQVRAELALRRHALLTGQPTPTRRGWRRPMLPAGALATAMAIAGVLWLGPKPQQIAPPYADVGIEEARAAAEESAASLDDDPEFFLWLASEPVADADQPSQRSIEGQQP